MTVFVGSHWCLLQHLYLPKLKFIASISGTVLWTFSGHDCSLFYIFKCFFSLTFAYSFQSPTCIGYILIIFNLVNFFVCTSTNFSTFCIMVPNYNRDWKDHSFYGSPEGTDRRRWALLEQPYQYCTAHAFIFFLKKTVTSEAIPN